MQGAFNQVNTVLYICFVKKTTATTFVICIAQINKLTNQTTSTVTKHNDADQDSTLSGHLTINTKVETVSLASVQCKWNHIPVIPNTFEQFKRFLQPVLKNKEMAIEKGLFCK